MRKFICVFCAIAFCISCSSVFEGGLSGQVYDGDGQTGYAGVMVYAYDSEKDRDADYDGYMQGENRDSSGNFVPNSDLYVPKVKTNANGEFTISKVVWKTTSPRFGKTDDVHNLYLMYYEEDARDTKFAESGTQSKLIKEERPYKIVSGSTNQASSFKTLYRQTRTFAGASGFVRNTENDTSTTPATKCPFGQESDDGVTLKLHYFDATCCKDHGSEQVYWKDASKSITESKNEYKRNGSVTTEATNEHSGNDDNKISATHGNFSGLGTSGKYELIYNSDEELGYVWFCIERDDGANKTYSEAKKVYADAFAWAVNYSRKGEGFANAGKPQHDAETNKKAE